MKKEEKKESIKFWDSHAESWEYKAYDKSRKFLNFPISQARQDITVKGICELAKQKKAAIADLGTADGELVIDLLKKGFVNATGFDNSHKMIERAKNKLKFKIPSSNPDKVFFIADVDEFWQGRKFDFISAMGLIEYLENVGSFFKRLRGMLNPGGYAFIESRNKLFNLFSANNFTSQFPQEDLVKDLEYSKKFSKIQNKAEIQKIIQRVFLDIAKNLAKTNLDTKYEERNIIDKFPFHLPQYSPREIENFSKNSGLVMKEIIYCHYHPFLPKFENEFPSTFNRIAVLMAPLGYTPVGATHCSSFIAVIKNEKK